MPACWVNRHATLSQAGVQFLFPDVFEHSQHSLEYTGLRSKPQLRFIRLPI